MLNYRTIFLTISVTVGILIACGQVSADTLVWKTGPGDVSGFRLYYGEDPKNLSKSLNVGKVYRYSLDALNLTNNTQYYFAVTAYNHIAESDFSNYVVWTRGDTKPPSPPANFNVN